MYTSFVFSVWVSCQLLDGRNIGSFLWRVFERHLQIWFGRWHQVGRCVFSSTKLASNWSELRKISVQAKEAVGALDQWDIFCSHFVTHIEGFQVYSIFSIGFKMDIERSQMYLSLSMKSEPEGITSLSSWEKLSITLQFVWQSMCRSFVDFRELHQAGFSIYVGLSCLGKRRS